MQLVSFERRDGEFEDSDRAAPEMSSHESERSSAFAFEGLDFSTPGATRLGALLPNGPREGETVDLNRALAAKLAADDVGAPEAEADSLLPSDMLRFLQAGSRAQQSARSVMSWVREALSSYSSPDLMRAGIVLGRQQVRHCAPVAAPGKVIGVACNYGAHADEFGQVVPEEPVLFLKAPSSLIGPGQEIVLPRISQQVDYQGELAVVMGRSAHCVAEADALDYVGGYMAANDVTARNFQNLRDQHFIGKSCDSFAPTGPVLVTPDEIEDPQELDLATTVSGVTRQKARTSEMIFSVRELIAFASQLMTLAPGDILLTGTPSGAGAAADPQRWLQEGDVVDVEIGGIGRLRTYVRSEGGAE